MKLKSALQRKTPAEIAVYAIAFCIFCVFAFTYVYMIFWCFYSGLRSYDEIARNPLGFSAVYFRNYIDVFSVLSANGSSFAEMLFNSVYFSMLGPFCAITVTSMLAYVTSKYKFFGAGSVYFIVIIVITLPVYGSSSALYNLLYNLNIINTRWMIITSFNGFTVYYLYFYAFYKNLSWSYAEAAMIDGANDWQIYFRIMLPQALTMFGALLLILWMADWNNYGSALIYLSRLPTLAVGIYLFETQMMYDSRLDILYAACAISLLPPLVMFIVCNNALMSNVSLGGIKE